MSEESTERVPCPNCRFQMGHSTTRCESCGYAYPKPASRAGEKIASVLLLVLFGVPAAFCGACSLVVGSTSALGWIMAVGGIGFFLVLAWLTASIFKDS